jgi:hypothetical protein
LTAPQTRNIIQIDLCKQDAGGRYQIGTPAGFGSELVAGFILECMAGFVGIRNCLRSHPIRQLESSKWKLWHGRSSACLGRLARLSHWFDAPHVRDVRGTAAVQRHINDLIEYLYTNQIAPVNYGRRRHA